MVSRQNVAGTKGKVIYTLDKARKGEFLHDITRRVIRVPHDAIADITFPDSISDVPLHAELALGPRAVNDDGEVEGVVLVAPCVSLGSFDADPEWFVVVTLYVLCCYWWKVLVRLDGLG